MKRVRVKLGDRSYDIVIGRRLLVNIASLVRSVDPGMDAVVITNAGLRRLYGMGLARRLRRAGFTVRFEIVPDSEKAKSVTQATRLLNSIGAYDVGRSIFIIALGGGVIGDLAGFVASTYRRGIPYIQIPTTLLAQVDSAIGGKVAIDLRYGKNLVGAFYQPRLVISDVSLLKTLPPRQMRNALAEIIKYGAIADSSLFRYLESNLAGILRLDPRALEHVISACSKIKAGIVSGDERDILERRMILNFGHTIGHAIETASRYSGAYQHGEAIALGMLVAAAIASELGMIRPRDQMRLKSLIARAGLPICIRGLRIEEIYRAHLHDKKFEKTVNRFVLPVSVGSVKIVRGVPTSHIRTALREHLSVR